jgi:hypothetical protein
MMSYYAKWVWASPANPQMTLMIFNPQMTQIKNHRELKEFRKFAKIDHR